MRKSCPSCERAAGTHGELLWDGSGASSELTGQDMQADKSGHYSGVLRGTGVYGGTGNQLGRKRAGDPGR